MLIIFNVVIHFPNCFTHLLGLVKIREGKKLLTRLSPSGAAAAEKTPANADRRSADRIHQKQAGEQPHGLVVTYSSLKDIQEKSTFPLFGDFFPICVILKDTKESKTCSGDDKISILSLGDPTCGIQSAIIDEGRIRRDGWRRPPALAGGIDSAVPELAASLRLTRVPL